jgi:hypothetical protein
MTSTTIERPWFVFAKLQSGEQLVPGVTEGCPGPDAWGGCPALAEGKAPACAGASWFYGPEPAWRAHITTVSAVCPFVTLDPLSPLSAPLD